MYSLEGKTDKNMQTDKQHNRSNSSCGGNKQGPRKRTTGVMVRKGVSWRHTQAESYERTTESEDGEEECNLGGGTCVCRGPHGGKERKKTSVT